MTTGSSDGSIEIKNELSDYRKTYPANIRCKDGHYVRSRAEKIIDDWLYDNDYIHVYEKPIYNYENKEEQMFIPDFYLKHEDVYIEFWGVADNESYLLKKEDKIAFYEKNGIRFISIEDKDIEHIDDVLPRLILKRKIANEHRENIKKIKKKIDNDSSGF